MASLTLPPVPLKIEQSLYVFWDFLSLLLCNHSDHNFTTHLHEQNLYVFWDSLSLFPCIHTDHNCTVHFHELILYRRGSIITCYVQNRLFLLFNEFQSNAIRWIGCPKEHSLQLFYHHFWIGWNLQKWWFWKTGKEKVDIARFDMEKTGHSTLWYYLDEIYCNRDDIETT